MKILKYTLLLCLTIAAFLAWQTYDYFSRPLGFSSYRIVSVSSQDSLREIGADLLEKEVIGSVEIFVMWARLFGHDKKLKAGEYGLPTGTTMNGLFTILTSGKSLGHRIVVPEGTNMYEIAAKLELEGLAPAKDFLQLITNKKFVKSVLGEERDSLEGYLFPDTYFFTKVDGVRTIAKKMVSRFLEKYKRVGKRPGWTRHQIVTLGSIIEKETGAHHERPLISSVFHNRLKKKMRLQTDPTVIYAKLLKTNEYKISISRADLQTDHPYNTYRRAGLPPGPISNAGVEALQAAVQPAESEYLYFVSKNDGTHIFSKNYKDHSSAVGTFQLDPKAREGKSWRDLKK